MNKRIEIVTVLILSTFSPLLAQWKPDVRLTNEPNYSRTFKQNIAVAGDTIHVVWYDDCDGNW